MKWGYSNNFREALIIAFAQYDAHVIAWAIYHDGYPPRGTNESH